MRRQNKSDGLYRIATGIRRFPGLSAFRARSSVGTIDLGAVNRMIACLVPV
jgi:hypothetical protein